MPQHHVPCESCPFLVAKAGMIRGGRAQELVTDLRNGRDFYCHKTIDYTRGEGMVTSRSQLCAGSLIVASRSGLPPSQMARISQRLGILDQDRIDQSDVPCFSSFTAFIRGHKTKNPVDIIRRSRKTS